MWNAFTSDILNLLHGVRQAVDRTMDDGNDELEEGGGGGDVDDARYNRGKRWQEDEQENIEVKKEAELGASSSCSSSSLVVGDVSSTCTAQEKNISSHSSLLSQRKNFEKRHEDAYVAAAHKFPIVAGDEGMSLIFLRVEHLRRRICRYYLREQCWRREWVRLQRRLEEQVEKKKKEKEKEKGKQQKQEEEGEQAGIVEGVEEASDEVVSPLPSAVRAHDAAREEKKTEEEKEKEADHAEKVEESMEEEEEDGVNFARTIGAAASAVMAAAVSAFIPDTEEEDGENKNVAPEEDRRRTPSQHEHAFAEEKQRAEDAWRVWKEKGEEEVRQLQLECNTALQALTLEEWKVLQRELFSSLSSDGAPAGAGGAAVSFPSVPSSSATPIPAATATSFHHTRMGTTTTAISGDGEVVDLVTPAEAGARGVQNYPGKEFPPFRSSNNWLYAYGAGYSPLGDFCKPIENEEEKEKKVEVEDKGSKVEGLERNRTIPGLTPTTMMMGEKHEATEEMGKEQVGVVEVLNEEDGEGGEEVKFNRSPTPTPAPPAPPRFCSLRSRVPFDLCYTCVLNFSTSPTSSASSPPLHPHPPHYRTEYSSSYHDDDDDYSPSSMTYLINTSHHLILKLLQESRLMRLQWNEYEHRPFCTSSKLLLADGGGFLPPPPPPSRKENNKHTHMIFFTRYYLRLFLLRVRQRDALQQRVEMLKSESLNFRNEVMKEVSRWREGAGKKDHDEEDEACQSGEEEEHQRSERKEEEEEEKQHQKKEVEEDRELHRFIMELETNQESDADEQEKLDAKRKRRAERGVDHDVEEDFSFSPFFFSSSSAEEYVDPITKLQNVERAVVEAASGAFHGFFQGLHQVMDKMISSSEELEERENEREREREEERASEDRERGERG